MNCKSLNNKALNIFKEYIYKSRESDTRLNPPFQLLEDSEYTDNLLNNIELDKNKQFRNRYEMGQYLDSIIDNITFEKYLDNVGLWSWIALFYFDQFCPEGKKINRVEHYILSAGGFKLPGLPVAYRHCVRGPLFALKKFPEIAKAIILGSRDKESLYEMGDFLEQTLSKPQILASNPCLKVIKKLYITSDGFAKIGCSSNPVKKKIKSGKWSKAGYGGIRRLTEGVLPRLKMTYNLEIMEENDIIKSAGKEFETFKDKEK